MEIYSKYFIVQRGIKSIFSMSAHCQNLNILNRRKTIQKLKTISDNVFTANILTIKGKSIDSSAFQYSYMHYTLAACSKFTNAQLVQLVYTNFLPQRLPTGFELYVIS